jgi:hypothetical protein
LVPPIIIYIRKQFSGEKGEDGEEEGEGSEEEGD